MGWWFDLPGRIFRVRKDSIAAELGIVPGDLLVSINGNPINDILDYQFWAQDDNLRVEIEKQDGDTWLLEIDKDYDESLGLDFEEIVFDRLKSCHNRCIFCFVDQLPPDMRDTLYIKDDDYRHSFVNGNFITLTNLKESDWSKISAMHLSPLYISVHCTQAELRQQMLQNRRAGTIKQDLKRLCDAGIQVHTQIVVCPGWNDGEILQETITDLAALYPGVLSAGIVPVGLTGHRHNLPMMKTLSAEAAVAVIEAIESNQDRFRPALGTGFVYGADELYIKAGREIPPVSYYDDFSQIENGIGLARVFLDDFASLKPDLPRKVSPRQVFLLTGESAATVLQTVVHRLNRIDGLTVRMIKASNLFFSGAVTVTGLLTGCDILAALNHQYQGQRVIIPEIILRDGFDVALDDMSLDMIKSSSGADIRTADSTAAGLVEALLGK